MKNYLKAFAFCFVIAFSISANANGHGGGHEAASAEAEHGGGDEHGKKKEKEGNFEKADLEDMKQDQLLTFLSSTNYQASEYATYYFQQRGEVGITPLMNYLKKHDDNPRIVSSVLYTFGRIGPKAARAVPVIAKYLNSDDPDLTKTAVSALGKIGKASEPAVPEIAKYLDDKNEWSRTLALRSLKDIGTPQAKAFASLYEKKLQLEQERKKRELLGADKNVDITPDTKTKAAVKEENKKH